MHLLWTLVNVFLQLVLISHISKSSLDRENLENHLTTAIPVSSNINGPADKENFTIGYLYHRIEYMDWEFKQKFDIFTSRIQEINQNKRNSNFLQRFRLNFEPFIINPESSVLDILSLFCPTEHTKHFAVMVIDSEMLHPSNHNSMLLSYIMYLASVLGVPVFTLSSDGFGLEQKALQYVTKIIPDSSYRSSAILSILQSYSWDRFSIVTTKHPGNYEFIQAIRVQMVKMQAQFEMTLETTIQLDWDDDFQFNLDKLMKLHEANSRIFVFYCTEDEAINSIFPAARQAGLIGKSFMWVGDLQDLTGWQPNEEEHLDVAIESLAVKVEPEFENLDQLMFTSWELLVDGVGLSLVNVSQNTTCSMPSIMTCEADGNAFQFGEIIMRNWASLFFTPGTIVDIFTFKRPEEFENCGTWTPGDLQMTEQIIWPGHSLIPPTGLPDKPHLKVTFKEEPPFIFMEPPSPTSGRCANRGVICNMRHEMIDSEISNKSETPHQYQCCTGYSIDLLKEFAADMDFTYDLCHVRDGTWGSEMNGQWNGLVAALINKEADIVLTSFNINSKRESVIDFSIPFLETKIAILVSKKSGTISAKAFLEPFDTISWIMILIVCIHAATFAIFLLEWMSPTGYNMTTKSHKDNILSMLRSYWLVWANFFGAAVNVNNPRSTSARFMTGVWALFALVLLGMYTANLTFFMSTPEQHLQLSGLYDDKLTDRNSDVTPLRYGTVPFGHTDSILRKYHPQIHRYMEQFNKSNAEDGLRAVMTGELDAFIYDATVLKYLVGKDENCLRLAVEGGNVMSAYGIGFPKHSQYLADFNQQIMMYKDNGYLDSLRQVWFTETCHPDKSRRRSSQPLSVDQCMSAFILLGLGMICAIVFLLIEQLYAQYYKNGLIRANAGRRCALVGVGSHQSSTFNRKMQLDSNSLEQHLQIMKRRARKRRIRHAWYTEH